MEVLDIHGEKHGSMAWKHGTATKHGSMGQPQNEEAWDSHKMMDFCGCPMCATTVWMSYAILMMWGGCFMQSPWLVDALLSFYPAKMV